jgi:glyoxylase-like metal-dependent hydrolase (beta-lactamase superfamily II)
MQCRTVALAFILAASAAAESVPKWCSLPRRTEFSQFQRVPSPDPWFEVYRLRPDTFAIYEPRQDQTVLSYLLLGSERALLFDSGLGIGQIDRVVSSLTKLPVSVVNSHTHFDHVGGNYAFKEVYGVDLDYTRRHAEGTPNSQVASQLNTESVCPPLPKGITQATYAIRPFHITRPISDGQVIDLGGRKLDILLTPGHTPDALCMLDRGNRLLLTGDTFYPGQIWLYLPETDVDAYQRSIARLAGLANQVDHLLPAHDAPQANPRLLGEVSAAFTRIRTGSASWESDKGRRLYKFEGFSILMAQPK